ncbi:hypothetical protein [Mucisphaera calidilacus]|uniref:Dockerin domain-containing protein n=1 Tax=Mucisphaera calidilacus TaxID=2527982 RepID=A0A518BYM4_9BACT|nr:hypothetical protein [Mucisphaera calidilacus]QDU72077.1 hypothetical protein Pan265_19390 [Mucisphaera calidilacus]
MDRTQVSARWLLTAALATGLTTQAYAEGEIEFNDDLLSAQPITDSYVYGYLGDGGFGTVFIDYELYGPDDFALQTTLFGDTSDYYYYDGFTPGRDFVVILDNDPSSGGGYGYFTPPLPGPDADDDDIAGTGFASVGFTGADLTLGLGDGTGDPSTGLLDTDDDGSPLGNGVASAIAGTVNPDGSIEVFVSGYPDGLDGTDETPPFDGSAYDDGNGNFSGHGEEGDYLMYIIFDVADPYEAVDFEYFLPAQELTPDVDFYRWDNEPYAPGQMVRAYTYGYSESEYSDLDLMMAVYDDAGNEIAFSDDGPFGVDPAVNLVVPIDGVFNIGITGYPDYDFLGDHSETGSYDLYLDLLGDLNYDGIVDANDIDNLFGNIGSYDLYADINLDGNVDDNDVDDLLAWLFGTVRGDANLDGSVDLLDLSLLAGNFDQIGDWAGGDFNGDGVVDLLDLSILAGNFGFAGFAVPLPTPASGALLATLALAGLRRRSA